MRPTTLILLLLAGMTAGAQTQNANPKIRVMTLPDCIQLALAHNLDLQIERIIPRLSLYDVDIAFAGWDPNFTVSGRHSFNLTGGSIDANKLVTPPSISDQNSFSSGLSGLTPIGGTYNLSGNIQESYGRAGLIVVEELPKSSEWRGLRDRLTRASR